MYSKINKDLAKTFSNSEMLTVLELARVALTDAEVYDYMADKLDMSDEDMKSLQEKLEKYMENT